MPSRLRIVLFVLALGIGAAIWIALALQPSDEARVLSNLDEGERAASEPLERASSAAVRGETAPSGDTAVDAPEPAPSAPAAPTALPASLRVRVVWKEPKEPASGIRLDLSRYGDDALFEDLEATTDAEGAVLFEDLAPGRAYVSAWRGDHQDFEKVELKAGERTELTLTLATGIRVTGRVLDAEERGVAEAEVLATGWTGGEARRVAVTDVGGAFELRGMNTHCHIGARAAGHAASPLTRCTASEGATVELTIRLTDPAAELNGVVLDPLGAPVVGAIVRAGSTEQSNRTLPDGSNAMGPREVQVRTDAEGRFRFANLSVGETPLAVRARELAPWQQTITTRSGVENYVAVHLEGGAVLCGTVRDAEEKGLEKVEVRCGDWDDLGFRRVKSGPGGAFRVTGLAPGKLAVHVEDDKRGKFETEVLLVAGEETRLDPVLSLGLVVKGRVLDASGAALKRVMVEAHQQERSSGASWWGVENTDDDGRFELKNCAPRTPLVVTFRRKSVFPEFTLRDVMPGTDELVVRMPAETWIWIQGSVTAPDGTVPANVILSPYKKDSGGSSPAETAEPKTGAFKIGPYPPGEYGLSIHAAGFAPLRIPERLVEPNETWDLGVLRLER